MYGEPENRMPPNIILMVIETKTVLEFFSTQNY